MLLCILGRQPHLGLAELEAVFGAKTVQPIGNEAALLDVAPEAMRIENFGGTIKLASVIGTAPTNAWDKVAGHCMTFLPDFFADMPEGKLTLGFSAYGLRTNARALTNLALQLKKTLRQSDRPVRIVPHTALTLNSAQVFHNNLDRANGAEILLVAHQGRTYLARTIGVQNVDSYSRRDFERPKRDARVGMLPPKLAQIMLNLANPQASATVFDPFCGTGVVLMEAALRGFRIEGSDLEQKMIDYTAANLEWLGQTYHRQLAVTSLKTADATSVQWHPGITTVVTETYLGRPLTTLPDRPALTGIINDCNTIIRKFLANLQPQLAPGARCCIAVPAWAGPRGFIHLPVVDELHQIGYNRIRFSCASFDELIYHRPDQTVARELLVLTPK